MFAAQSDTAAAIATPAIASSEMQSMGVSMLIVVAIIVLLGWLYSRSRFVSGGAGDIINVVASRALGARERLLLVEVSDQQLLIGMTSTAVQTLHVFDKPIEIAEALSTPAGFKGRLVKALQEIRK